MESLPLKQLYCVFEFFMVSACKNQHIKQGDFMIIVITGAGVVGSWIAYELSKTEHEIFLIDKEPAIWYHTSTRNSGVIHAGIYYPYHTLKRIFCIEGAKLSYEFFKKYNVEHRMSGKIIVANNDEDLDDLKRLKENGDRNGVENLKLIDSSEIKKLEPFSKSKYALYSPNTGVVNCSDYFRKMEALLQENKVNIITNCNVENVLDNKIITNRGNLEFDIFINAAGLYSDKIASMCNIKNFEIMPFKGEYYSLNNEKVNGMIYPVPGKHGHLGIHLTKAAYNEIWIGPTSKQVNEKESYDITENQEVYSLLREELLTEFNPNKITPGFTGIRAKCFYNNQMLTDFLIFRKANKVHLLGIDSPGLTAAPAIGKFVKSLIFQ